MPASSVPTVTVATASRLEPELKRLIVEALHLEEVEPDSIDAKAPLFGEGLGLDSIDVLELAMAINKRYGVRTKADDDRNQSIFATVENLALFIAEELEIRGAAR